MSASHAPEGTFAGGCTCSYLSRKASGCTCGWGAFAARLESLAQETDPAEFVRETGKLAGALDALLATRRPEAMRAAVARCGGIVEEAAGGVGLSRQRVYKLMERTGRNHKK